jgi:aspartyl-tRNA(Asn)/glutamyl-tRNA(Gln) amidotransferase subunit A
MTTIGELTATELLRHFRKRTLSPAEVARDVLSRIAAQNPKVNAFCRLYEDETLAAASASEARWLANEPVGLLDGLPVTVKDMMLQKGHPNRRGSHTSSPLPVNEDSPVVARMREAGAVFVGRTTAPEFAWKGLSDSPLTGITRNPWDMRKTAGGSSSGAAVAGALNLGVLHLGSDGAGSIRIPCSFCGIYGIKPSFGRVPTYPASAFAVVSHIGPQARTVDDAALALSVMSAPDHRDMTAFNTPAPDFRIGLERGVKGLKIAFSSRLGYVENLEPEVEALCRKAAAAFEELGAKVEEVDPGFADPRDILMTIWKAGAAGVLRNIDPLAFPTMDQAFLRYAQDGTKLTAVDFINAVNARSALSIVMAGFHRRYDLLLTPTLSIPAFEAGRDVPEGSAPDAEWIDWTPYSYPFNLTLQPAATVPCGLTGAGLPVGLQIVGPVNRDDLVLAASKAFESARPFARVSEPRAVG